MMKSAKEYSRNILRKWNRKSQTGLRSPKAISSKWIRVALMVGTTVALALMMSIQLLPDRVTLHLGDISTRDILAPRTVVYVDTEATSRLQQAAVLSTASVYDPIINASEKASRNLAALFETFANARNQSSTKVSIPLPPLNLPQSQEVVSLPQPEFAAVQITARMIISSAMLNDIRDDKDDLKRALKDVSNEATLKLSDSQAEIVSTLARAVVTPTMKLNLLKTNQSKELAAQSVKPVYEPISRGDKIIAKSDRVTQEQLDSLRHLD